MRTSQGNLIGCFRPVPAGGGVRAGIIAIARDAP
jgi:hypothetical protein